MPPRIAAPPPPTRRRGPFPREIGQLDRAVNDLRRRAPEFSAATPLRAWQRLTLLIVPATVAAALVLLEGPGLFLWSLTLALPFLAVALVRMAAVAHVLLKRRRRPGRKIDRRFDGRLPTYSVLVPLYHERRVVPSLVKSMARLDYPMDRLEILFITEADDHATRRALLEAGLRPNMRIVTVPKGQPKTKPRALNYALQDARGVLVAVFDAEDIPEPDQLRRAASAFIEGGPRLACVQAQLLIHNADQSFWSGQLAHEYSALFCGLLPALDFLRLPIPLGGTSNHFRRDLLLKCGGWDPFNVTEDADLGVRLARLGYDVSVIDSRTLEEAPAARRSWIGQRTRWIKGWIQTYLVHMRRPLRLWRDLGSWRFTGFQVTVGATILSMLVHPWFFILAAWHGLPDWEVLRKDPFWLICGVTLTTGYGAAWLLIVITALRSDPPRRLWSVLWLPFYWLAISFAAYRALGDLIIRPFYWEKTMHGVSVKRAASDHRRLRAVLNRPHAGRERASS